MALGKEFFLKKKKQPYLKEKNLTSLPSAADLALGKAQIKKIRNRPHFFKKTFTFAECPPFRHSAKSLCRMPELGTRQSIIFFLVLPPNFFFSPYTLSWSTSSNLAHFSIFLLYILNLFHLIDFSGKCKFELQVHRIMKFDDWKNDIRITYCILRPYPGACPKFQTSHARNMATKLRVKCFLII